MTEEIKITPEDKPQSPQEKCRPILHSCFDDRFISKPPFGYLKPSIAIVDVSCFWMLKCLQPACFCKLRADKNYEQKTSCLGSFISRAIAQRNSPLFKALSYISNWRCIGLCYCSCCEWGWRFDRSGRCFEQGSAAWVRLLAVFFSPNSVPSYWNMLTRS